MSFKGAVDRTKTWAVTGVTTNYGLDGIPGDVPEAALPALLLLPSPLDERALKPFDIQASAGQFVVHLDHVLLISGAGMKRPQEAMYKACQLVDDYLAKVKTDWTLNANLVEPLQIVGAGLRAYPLGALVYWAVVFRHRWALVV